MKLLFVITGFGFGDSIRASAIMEEFMKRSKNNQIVVLGYDTSYKIFKNKFQTLRIPGYDFPDKKLKFKAPVFMMRNALLPVNWIATLRKHRKYLKEFDPDFILSNFEPSAILIANSLDKKCFSVFGYDPKSYNSFPRKNVTLKIQSAYIENLYKSSYKVLIPSFIKRDNYLNVNYVNPVVRAKKLPSDEKIMKELKLKRKPIVVMLGGSDFGIELGKEILKYSRNSKENFLFFGGSKKISRKHVKFTDTYLKYLKVAKGVISLAGNLTISECLYYKKPMLLFPVKNHVEQQINAFNAQNFAMMGSKNIKGSVREFLKNLNFIKKNMPNLKFNGAKQIVDLIYREKKK